VDRLLELLGESAFPYRVAVAGALGRTSDPRVPTALAEVLADPDPALRGRSARAIGELAQRSTFEPSVSAAITPRLLSLLAEDPEPLVRYEAYTAIFSCNDWASQGEALSYAARDTHPLLNGAYLRSAASLAHLSGEQSTIDDTATLLRARLSRLQPSYSSRTLLRAYQLSKNAPCGLPIVEVARGLGVLRREEDVETLLHLADNSEAAIRDAALDALGQMGGTPPWPGSYER
jgi:HEAT repeat protein